ncbi:hypothetical protein RUMCAL_01967 [Ruminococcus callidus ATCC 27760]|uniref:Uncharacterized protein n=1 Tax=Ruminococcus callidus ATCC 27760 TaxID=411473 RepID=U2K889_9FIRM|nr:hypothetical protein RUMCAL_01967 [Ruminococcus callidus ATCC 27760]
MRYCLRKYKTPCVNENQLTQGVFCYYKLQIAEISSESLH